MKKDMFYVFVEGGQVPKTDHADYCAATAEAIRLVEKQKKTAHVLRCIDTFNPTVEEKLLPCKICGVIPQSYVSMNASYPITTRCHCGVEIHETSVETSIRKWNKLMEVK